jgi:hypothetical protein
MMPKELIIGLEMPWRCSDYSLFIRGDGKIVYEVRHCAGDIRQA